MMKKRATKSATKRNLKSKAKSKASPKKKSSRVKKQETAVPDAAVDAVNQAEPTVQGPVGTDVTGPTDLAQPTQV